MQRLLRGQLLRHEAQFNERPHAIRQQAIVNLIHVRKVVNRIAVRILIVEPGFVVENSVEADVLEAGRLLHLAQVLAIGVAQAQNRASRPEHLLPEVWKWMARRGGIDFDGFCGCGGGWLG